MLSTAQRDNIFLDYCRTRNFIFNVEDGKVFNQESKELGYITGNRCHLHFTCVRRQIVMSRARAIWLWSFGMVRDDLQVIHKSQDSLNDSIRNLELGDASKRAKNAVRANQSRDTFGKLTLEQVNAARVLKRNNPDISYLKIAKLYNVALATIISAIQGKTWKDAAEIPVPAMEKIPTKIYISKRYEKEKEFYQTHAEAYRLIRNILIQNPDSKISYIQNLLTMKNLISGITSYKLNVMVERIREEFDSALIFEAA